MVLLSQYAIKLSLAPTTRDDKDWGVQDWAIGVELVEFFKLAHNGTFAGIAVVSLSFDRELIQIQVYLVELVKADEVGYLQKRRLLLGKRGRVIIKPIKDAIGVASWFES